MTPVSPFTPSPYRITFPHCVRNVMGTLSKLRRFRKVLPIALQRKLFQAFVLPHADYRAVVWQKCTKELQIKVEMILNYGVRLILSQPPRTPSGEMRRTLHWMPLERRRVMFRLILLNRCLNNLAPAYTLLNLFAEIVPWAMPGQGALTTLTSSLLSLNGEGDRSFYSLARADPFLPVLRNPPGRRIGCGS